MSPDGLVGVGEDRITSGVGVAVALTSDSEVGSTVTVTSVGGVGVSMISESGVTVASFVGVAVKLS